MMNIITREDAIKNGLQKYFTGKYCKNMHLSERYTKHRNCIQCGIDYREKEASKQWLKEYNKKRRQTDEYKEKEKEIRNRPNALLRMKEYSKTPKMRIWRSQYEKKKRETDIVYAMRRRACTLIALKINKKGFTKRSITKDILGCDWETFKVHIERQFTKGMNWDNRSEWDLDHIIPTSSANTEDELKALLLFTNVRPMWKKDNIYKSSKILYLI